MNRTETGEWERELERYDSAQSSEQSPVRVLRIFDRSLCFPASLYLLVLSLLTRTGGPNPVGLVQIPCGASARVYGIIEGRAARKFDDVPVVRGRCPGKDVKADGPCRHWEVGVDHLDGTAENVPLSSFSPLLPLSLRYCSLGVSIRLCNDEPGTGNVGNPSLVLSDGRSNCTESPNFDSDFLSPMHDYVKIHPEQCMVCGRPARLVVTLSPKSASRRESYRILDSVLRNHDLLGAAHGSDTLPPSHVAVVARWPRGSGAAFRAVYHEFPSLSLGAEAYDILLPPVIDPLLMLLWAAVVGYAVCRRDVKHSPYLCAVAANGWLCCWVAASLCAVWETATYGVTSALLGGCHVAVLCREAQEGREAYEEHEGVHFEMGVAEEDRERAGEGEFSSSIGDLELYAIGDENSVDSNDGGGKDVGETEVTLNESRAGSVEGPGYGSLKSPLADKISSVPLEKPRSSLSPTI